MPGPFTPTPITGLRYRVKDDHYDTPSSCTEALLDREPYWPHNIWEPAVGNGAIMNVLLKHPGMTPWISDIVDRGIAPQVKDFLTFDRAMGRSIITNPPFSLAERFVLHGISLGIEKMAMFQRLTWLEGAARYDRLWSAHPPVRIWQFCKRQTLWRGDDANARDKGGTIAFAWFVWERGYTGAPAFGWIR